MKYKALAMHRKKVISTLSYVHSVILVVGLSTLAYAGEGQFVTLDFPGSTNTEPTAINPAGEIVGRYFSPDGRQHGFVLSNDAYTSLDVPGTTFTDAAWINARGDIVGIYVLAGETQGHGYVLKERYVYHD